MDWFDHGVGETELEAAQRTVARLDVILLLLAVIALVVLR